MALLSRRALCGAGVGVFCCLPALGAELKKLVLGPLHLVEVASGLFVSHGVHAEATPANEGAIANCGFIVGEKGVAVIDTGGCRLWGERLREAIRAVTALPVTTVILTHMHPDHVFGTSAFLGDQPAVIAHAKLPRALANREESYRRHLMEALGPLAAGSDLVMPTAIVADRMTIDLGGRALFLTAHKTAHTDNDLSVFDQKTSMLWAGDLLFMERIPVLDGSLLGWLEVMEALAMIDAKAVVPGHGPHSAAWPEALQAQRRYLGGLRDGIRALLRQGGTMERAIAEVGQREAPEWLLF